jgi:hypothetical protein
VSAVEWGRRATLLRWWGAARCRLLLLVVIKKVFLLAR